MTTSELTTAMCPIGYNGPFTSFSLKTLDGRELHLCREDLPRLANGHFSFDDGRSEIDVGSDDMDLIAKQATKLCEDIEKERFRPDIGGYSDHFRDHEGAYGALVNADLGAYFICVDKPFAFLGAQKRARTYKLVAENLIDGSLWKFTVAYMERALAKESSSTE